MAEYRCPVCHELLKDDGNIIHDHLVYELPMKLESRAFIKRKNHA